MQAAAQTEKDRLAEASNPDKVALSVLSSHNSSLPYLEGSTVRGTIVELNRRTVKIDAGLSQRIRFFRQALPWLGCRHHAGGDPCHSWGSCFSRGAGALSRVSLLIAMPWDSELDSPNGAGCQLLLRVYLGVYTLVQVRAFGGPCGGVNSRAGTDWP